MHYLTITVADHANGQEPQSPERNHLRARRIAGRIRYRHLITNGAPATIPRDLVFQQGKARIELDSQSNTITFVQCHFRNSFWTLRPSPRFTCPVSDVLDVYHQRHESRRSSPSYETRIVTTQGKASIFLPTDAPQDAQLQPIRQALAPVCKGTPSGGFMQSPMFIYVLGFVGGVIGLVAILVYQGLMGK